MLELVGGLVQDVDLAGASEGALTLGVGGGVRSGEELALVVGDELLDLDEGVSLENPASSGIAALNGVAVDVLPYIVDGVEEGAAAQGRATACSLVDVVVFHCYMLITSGPKLARSGTVQRTKIGES